MQLDLDHVTVGDVVDLLPEPANPVHPNAIKLIANDELIGYLPRDLADRVWAEGEPSDWYAVVCQVFHQPQDSWGDYDLDPGKRTMGVRITMRRRERS